jgi:beta-glucosidase
MTRIDELLDQMSLDEQAALTAGRDVWHVDGVERLGVAALKVTDGPVGARGDGLTGSGTPTLLLPCGTAMAATFDPDLIRRGGEALGTETRDKGARMLLAPTVNVHRSPLAGRNFECFSEDPHLSARMAVAYIQGVQSQGVSACVKHFVANDQEYERNSIEVVVDERALREIYLPAFEAAVTEAGVWSVMGAYNRLNGPHFCCDHRWLLTDVLQDEWGFEGAVISDWFAVHSTSTIANGLDIEMPGPARHLGRHLPAAVAAREVDEDRVSDAARRVLFVAEKAGLLDDPIESDELGRDRDEHRALAREIAAAGIVLLKNDGHVLPLPTDASVAVIGPNAGVGVAQGGGSAQVNPYRAVSPLQGITARSESAPITYRVGGATYLSLPVIDRAWLPEGITVEYFANRLLEGSPAGTDQVATTRMVWFDSSTRMVDTDEFSIRARGPFVPPESGTWELGCTAVGQARVSVDGEVVADNWDPQGAGDSFFGMGSPEVRGSIDLEAGRSYDLVVEYSGVAAFAAVHAGAAPVPPADAIEQAETAARDADVAVVVVGLNHDWETEGHDRTTMALPDPQPELIRRVAAANDRTVIVVNAGAPVDLDWLDGVPAAIQLWYPGQEGGHALADVLYGDVNPAGRLPFTVPRRIEDNPSDGNYPGEGGKVHYREGIFVGYRHYQANGIEPALAFGHGLSYTRFDYGDATVDVRGGEIVVEVPITNAGDVAGAEVVQCYVHDVEASVPRPPAELKGFTRVMVQPGETALATLTLDERALAFWHPERGEWTVEPGEFVLHVGAASDDIRTQTRLTWPNS